MADRETTGKNQGGAPPWQPGQSGNPAGRPKGSRNKFAMAFIDDFYADWQESGADTIKKVRAEDPATYLRVAASLLPKEFKVEHVGDDLSDSELDQRIRQLAGLISVEIGADRASGTEEAAAGPKQARVVSTLQ